MAQYPVTHRCGHLVIHQITGPDTPYRGGVTRREWIANQRAAQPCRNCRPAEPNEQAAALGAKVTAVGLPALRGTTSQVTWAEQLRAVTMADLNERLEPYDADIAARFREIVLGAAQRFDDACWWIDHRFSDVLHALLWELTDDEQDRIRALQRQDRARRQEKDDSDHG